MTNLSFKQEVLGLAHSVKITATRHITTIKFDEHFASVGRFVGLFAVATFADYKGDANLLVTHFVPAFFTFATRVLNTARDELEAQGYLGEVRTKLSALTNIGEEIEKLKERASEEFGIDIE
ncbi:hypothetical protein LTR53_008939 [Teratosphaeriaceae sp. CCFEE 6253]|nr:hypothetical protein LTR53_008939 [Teratosphaeriaceae sp. CCFEE 6253]